MWCNRVCFPKCVTIPLKSNWKLETTDSAIRKHVALFLSKNTIGSDKKSKCKQSLFSPCRHTDLIKQKFFFYSVIKMISLNQGVFGSTANDSMSRDFMRRTGEGNNTKNIKSLKEKKKTKSKHIYSQGVIQFACWFQNWLLPWHKPLKKQWT